MTATRDQVLVEARRWLGAKWHHAARLRYKAVDCGQLLIDVYAQTGVIDDFTITGYPRQWAIHQNDERYLDVLRGYAKPVAIPKPADIVVFKVGRTFSHGGIVVDWPIIIHANVQEGVVYADASVCNLADRAKLFFSVFEED